MKSVGRGGRPAARQRQAIRSPKGQGCWWQRRRRGRRCSSSSRRRRRGLEAGTARGGDDGDSTALAQARQGQRRAARLVTRVQLRRRGTHALRGGKGRPAEAAADGKGRGGRRRQGQAAALLSQRGRRRTALEHGLHSNRLSSLGRRTAADGNPVLHSPRTAVGSGAPDHITAAGVELDPSRLSGLGRRGTARDWNPDLD